MKITTEIFEKSFFSIGGGLDIEPLLRFSHISDFFINVNLFLSKDYVIQWYDRAFQYCDDIEVLEKKVINEFDEEEFFELHEDYISHLTNPDFISREALVDYQNAFSPAIGLNQYAIIYKLYRKSVNRTITYYHCTAEGLASYLTLSQNGRYAPIALCTIETGVLEQADSVFNDFFLLEKKKGPNLWIRGFEPRYHPSRPHINSFDSIGLYKNKVLDFNSKWTSGWSYSPKQLTVERHCKGYVSDEILSKLKSLTLKKEFQSDKDCFLFKPLNPKSDKIRDKDCLIISKKTKIDLENINCKILYWEHYTFNHYWRRIVNVNEQFEKISKRLRKMPLPSDAILHIIPFCLEDEGVSYYNSIARLNFKTVTYVPNLYDFIDLKHATHKT